MAFVGTDTAEEEDMRPTTSMSPGAHATLPDYSQDGGGGGFVEGGTGSGSGQGAVKASAAPTGGGGYVNLMQYLQANQGTGGVTGQAAENVVKNSADDANTANTAYSKAGSGQIADATKPLGVDQTVLDNIKSGTATVDPKMLAKIAAGTSGNLQYPGYKGPAAGDVNITYGGPMGLGDFTGDARGASLNATQANGVLQGNVNNAKGGQYGLTALTRQAYGQPGYTQGENNLDAFLAGGTSVGKAALAQAPKLQKQNDSSYSKINNALTGQISGAQKTAAATNATYGQAISQGQATSAATAAAYKKAVADKEAADKKAATAIGDPVLKAPPAVTSGAGGGIAPAAPGTLNYMPAGNNTPINLKTSNVNASKIQPGYDNSGSFSDPSTGFGQNYAGNATSADVTSSKSGGWNGVVKHLPFAPTDPTDPFNFKSTIEKEPRAAFGGKIPAYKSILDKLGRR